MSATPDSTLANPEQRIADLERQLSEAQRHLKERTVERDEAQRNLNETKTERDEALAERQACERHFTTLSEAMSRSQATTANTLQTLGSTLQTHSSTLQTHSERNQQWVAILAQMVQDHQASATSRGRRPKAAGPVPFFPPTVPAAPGDPETG